MNKIKFATIGTSNITNEFITGTEALQNMLHSAIYSRTKESGEAFSSKHKNVPVYTSLDELCKADIDAVYVASPNKYHYEQCKFLLEHGKHVLCEKSVSAHPEEVKDLQNIASKNNLIFMEALMFMHFPSKNILTDALSKIGNIYSVNLNFCQRSSRYDALMAGALPNIFNPECETGALLDLGVYCVYPALYYFGMPNKIKASSQLLPTGVDGTGSVIFEYSDKIVNLSYSKLCQGMSPSEFTGDNGSVTVDSISQLGNITLYPRSGKPQQLWGIEDKPTLMSYEASAFADFVISGNTQNEYYKRCSELSLMASKVMYEVRMQTGIIYQSDK